MCCTAGYAAILAWTPVDFRIVTAVFFMLTGLILARNRRRAAWLLALLAIGVSLGVHEVFTVMFDVQLP